MNDLMEYGVLVIYMGLSAAVIGFAFWLCLWRKR